MWLCQFFCCSGKVNFVQIPYSHDRFSKISRNFFVKKMIPYKTYVWEDQLFLALYGSTTIQSLFLKYIKNFVWFPKQYLLGFFILERNLFFFLINTLLLYIPLLALTDERNYGGTNWSWLGWVTYGSSRLILVGLGNPPGSSRLILVGLGNPPGEFFSSCAVVSVFGSGGK